MSLLFLFAFFDEFPETGMLLQLFIFRHRQLRTKKEIPDGVFVQNAVDQDTLRAALEVNPVIVGSIAIETFSFPLNDAESLGIEAVKVIGQKLELSEQLQLKFFGDSGHLGGTDFVEDDLIHKVSSRVLSE